MEHHPVITELRNQIDQIDESILRLLSERFIATREIGTIKAQLDLPVQSLNRETEQFDRLRELAKDLNVDPDLVYFVYRALIDKVIDEHRHQRQQ